MDERIIALIGKENFNKIQNCHVLIVGLGGVGGICAEALVRSGVGKLTLIDNDSFEKSNLNRQILANIKTIGKSKVEVAKKYFQNINPNIIINTHEIFLNKENINILHAYDYIIDACDTITTKVLLIKYAKQNNIKIISSMGTGKHMDPTNLKITTLNKTYNCPLAKKLRTLLKKENVSLNIPVVFSEEIPLNNEKEVSSMMFVPATAGIYLAYYVISDLIKK